MQVWERNIWTQLCLWSRVNTIAGTHHWPVVGEDCWADWWQWGCCCCPPEDKKDLQSIASRCQYTCCIKQKSWISYTHFYFLRQADQLAAGLVALKLQRGDRIGIWGPNSYEWSLTQWAAARAGLILVDIGMMNLPFRITIVLSNRSM